MGDPVTNLSKYSLTDSEHTALINGLDHVYPPEKLDQPQFVCNMEYFYARLLNVRTAYRHYEQKSATEVVRHQLTSLQLSVASELRETANSFRKVAQSELKKIGAEHRKTFDTLRSLAKNKSIIITRPDKGRGMVIMDRADYVQKMNAILDDRSAFTLINHDPTLDNENELIKFLLVLKKEGFISDKEFKLASPIGSRPARIYGVPKLHKKQENYPLRPVMSATKTVAYGLEETLMDRLKQSGVCQWYRYVDDTFVLIEPTTKVENVLEILNNFHPSISFTHQLETNGSLPFLDVWVTRSTEAKKFQTAVYRKETFTGLMIKWDSYVPGNYKKASVVTMIQRALALCSTYSSLATEFENIRQIGQHNGYPLSFIDTRIGIGLSKYLKKSTIPGTTIVGCEKQKMYIEIPYTGAPTDSFKKKLSHIAGKIRPDVDVRFFAKLPSSVQMFFNTKDPVPKHLRSDIVYSVKCSDCGDLYVGETERQAIRRLWEHGAPKTLFKEQLLSTDNTSNSTHPEDDYHEPEADETLLPTRRTLKKTSRKRAIPYPDPQTLRCSERIRQKTNTCTESKTSLVQPHIDTDDINKKKETTTKTAETSISRHQQQTGHTINWQDFKNP
ncbi:unnamed protein product [Rotaria sordida]|uniref:Helix-turn-helix domain-containing protein n=2 Tax=Rotaria sordida TaxID=392033 RepID=A0A815SLF2_9BILA|nr:unnamed protein product [Rotaria sordida]